MPVWLSEVFLKRGAEQVPQPGSIQRRIESHFCGAVDEKPVFTVDQRWRMPYPFCLVALAIKQDATRHRLNKLKGSAPRGVEPSYVGVRSVSTSSGGFTVSALRPLTCMYDGYVGMNVRTLLHAPLQ